MSNDSNNNQNSNNNSSNQQPEPTPTPLPDRFRPADPTKLIYDSVDPAKRPAKK